jgi:N-acetyl-anhydromuramoyl-L-alanine amidase
MVQPMRESSVRWVQGWLDGVRHCPSPNAGVRPEHACIDLIVVHAISLPPGIYGTDCVERLFTNTLDWDAHPYFQTLRGLEVSAHFFIARCGHITQFASLAARAWHAGVSQWRGRDNCNNDSVGIELEGQDGDSFTPAQYAQLTLLCHALMQVCPIAHIAGHEHIAPGRKTDPGLGFDWAGFERQLAQPHIAFPPHGISASK